MNILKDKRGQAPGAGTIMGIMGAVMGVIILGAMLPVMNTMIGSIVGGNMDAFGNAAMVQMLIGLVPLIVVVMFIYGVIQGFIPIPGYTPRGL